MYAKNRNKNVDVSTFQIIGVEFIVVGRVLPDSVSFGLFAFKVQR
jgi:hypothetical protein